LQFLSENMNLLYYFNFIIPFGNIIFPILTAEYHNSRQKSIISVFWKYLIDIRREAWLNLFF
jgi:hypothetical protein